MIAANKPEFVVGLDKISQLKDSIKECTELLDTMISQSNMEYYKRRVIQLLDSLDDLEVELGDKLNDQF